MKKGSLIIIAFPSIVMLLITIMSFSMMTNSFYLDWKGIFLISLILGFPLLFLVQGLVSAVSKTNVLLSAGLSLITFLILLIIYLNESALMYMLIYLVFEFIGYGIGYGISKVKVKNLFKR